MREHAKAMLKVAESLSEVAGEMKAHRIQAKPMHDFYETAGDALTCTRTNLKKWGPWLLGSIPVVISVVNGVSPQMAKLIQAIVNVVGSIPQ